MIWILLLVLLAGPRSLEAADSPQPQTVSPAVQAALEQDFKTADLVFRASLAGISLADLGLRQTPAPVVMFSFEKMEILKGERPKWSAFIFENLPEGAAFSKGSDVLVFLRKTGASDDFRIASMSKVSAGVLAALEGFPKPTVKES